MSSPARDRHELAFEAEAHAFTIDGRPAPSVTAVAHVLDAPELDDWRARVGDLEAERRRNAAADFGKRLHAAAATIARGGRLLEFDGAPARWRESVERLRDWYAEHVVDVLAIEEPVASTRWHYAGIVDAVVQLRDRRRPDIIDYKSSAGVYLSHVLQVAGYQLAEEEWNGRKCGRVILHLPAPIDTAPVTMKAYRLSRDASDRAAFLCTRSLYNRTKEPIT